MVCDSLGSWFPMNSTLLMALLWHIHVELKVKNRLDQSLHNKFFEMGKLFFKIRTAFESIRAEMTHQTEAVLKEQNKKMKRFGAEICATYIGTVVYGPTGLLEEKKRLMNWWSFGEVNP